MIRISAPPWQCSAERRAGYLSLSPAASRLLQGAQAATSPLRSLDASTNPDHFELLVELLWDVSVELYPAAGQTQVGPPIVVTLGESEPNFRHLTLHEFGHVFGLNDTYNGAGGCVPNQPSSVMCQDAAFTVLQTDDVRGARQAFREGVPQAYTYFAGSPAPLRAHGSDRCIDVIGFGTANATKVHLWDCPTGPTTNQVFGYNLTTMNLVGEGSGKCLEIENFDNANGARVQIWDCWGGINQQWTFGPNGSVRSVMNGKCLEVANFGTANGSVIQMWDCHGGINQQWTFR